MASSSSSHQKNQELISFSGIQSAGERKLDSESSYNEKNQELISFSGIQSAGKIRPVSEEKELGNSFPSTIETAIRSAKVHIAIFSKRYAESAWCLNELLLMLESEAKIIPVFYQVKPWDLRHIEEGEYAKAFIKHKENGRYHEKQLNAWKKALEKVSFIAGEEIYSECDGQKIVAAVQKEVQRKTCLHVAEYPVGLDNLVEDFERRCLDQLVQDLEDQCRLEEGNHQAKVVGIFGLGGSGKTTLAKELFNRKKSNYTTASFLSDVREASERSELPLLQSKLIKDLFGREISFRREDEGTSYLKDHLSRAPILSSLIVVDDIDHVDQLNALLVTDFLNKSGNSLVIVTSRDVGVLTAAGITVVYNLKGMDRNDAKELFCFHAFGERDPCSGYEVLVNHFVDVCGGLPLSLKVLGRNVHGRDHKFWNSALIKAKTALHQDVRQKLKISFDALDREEQEVFMDIACFFVGKQASRAERILEGSGWNVCNAMERLKDKCLVEKGELPSQDDMGPVLRMHDQLRDLGREMALELSPPHRLWRPQDLRSLESKGFKTILAQTNIRCFHSFFDESMGCLVKFFLGQPDAFFETSASLLWLQLEDITKKQRNIPSWIPLKNLQCLKINCSVLKTLWENDTQAPTQLKELQICHSFGRNPQSKRSECSAIEELRLERLSVLEKICIQNCYSLKSVSGISNQSSLVELEIINCRNLYFENLCLSGMKCLERINFVGKVSLKYFRLDGCPKLNIIEGLNCNGLVELSIRDCPELKVLPVGGNPYLEKIIVDGCGKLNRINGFPCNSLAELSIRDCPALTELPDFISSSCFEKTIIDGCGKLKYFELRDCQNFKNVSGKCPELEGLPSSVILSGLEHLEIYSCQMLQNITLPTTLIGLSVQSCKHLQRVAGIGELTKLIIKECPELQELPSLVSLSCLEEIDISFCHKLQNITLPATLITLSLQSCKALQRVAGIGDLPKLTKLIITECSELEELPSLVRLSCLEEIDIGSCGKLQNILLPTTLNSLSVQSCRGLQRVAGISDLQKLTKLIIKECPELEELPTLAGLSCLQQIYIDSCEKLQNITLPTTLISLVVISCRDLQRVAGIGDLLKLTKLIIKNCPELEESPSFARLSCVEEININFCEKLQNIMLPTTLNSLSVQSCRGLQGVVGIGDLMKLTKLIIKNCPELEELPSLARLSFFEIDSCEKLQNLAAIEQLQVSEYIGLFYCSNALIRNCIHKLKIVSSEGTMIGRAADGAESTLNKNLFCEGNIGVDGVIEIGTHKTYTKGQGLSAVIVCLLVVVDSTTSVEDINEILQRYNYRCINNVREGEWIITMVTCRDRHLYAEPIVNVFRRKGVLKKGFRVEVKYSEEWKTVGLLRVIVDRLHHL